MTQFDFKKIENRWKDNWYKDNIYAAEDFSKKPKKYIMAEFPYPSGKSMHVGHMMRYTVPEIYSRYLRMKGYNVLFPMGWDAFGLPAENYAIKTGIHPAVQTEKLVNWYRQSMKDMGYGIDWAREINTTDPKYFKWTQWIFLKFFEEGLAEIKEEPVWWCEEMGTVLAEEEVIKDDDGNLISERGEYPVERKMLKQWVLKMPEYADKLIDGLEDTEFPEYVKAAQTNWIGRSHGTMVEFDVKDSGVKLEAFTTRIDTIFGVTFMVIAPEHPLVKELMEQVGNKEDVQKYIDATAAKTELERQQSKEKTGVRLEGIFAMNPFDNSVEIPVFLADYVLKDYGTGIVMGVPAHDERDWEFAKKFELDIIPTITDKKGVVPDASDPDYQCMAEYGYVVNSGEFDGMKSEDAKQKMAETLKEMGKGHLETTYKIRDWVFSRQRYWGEPVPIIHKEDGTLEAVVKTDNAKEVAENLPLELPEVPDFSPSKDGSSPLAANAEWVNTTAKDGSAATRETNTMPNWAGSCWYYMRYLDPHNDERFADFDKLKYWLPVDHYFGGSEHTTMHLLYSRFWHKFLYDQGEVPTKEPYLRRTNGGILLGEDGRKMSKSVGNVIEPQEKLDLYGADAVRLYVAFIGPYEGTFPYNEASLKACHRLVKDIYELQDKVGEGDNDELNRKLHKMLAAISSMIEDHKMNTVVSEFMVFTKELKAVEVIPVELWKTFIKAISPFMVFTAEDLWQEINEFKKWESKNSVHLQEWPEFDPELIKDDEIEIPVQVNGKMRGVVVAPAEVGEDEIRKIVETDSKISEYISGKEIMKFIYVPQKIVNVIIK